MTVKELQTILKYSEIDPDRPVKVTVKKEEGHLQTVDIECFNIYTDCLNIIVKVGNEL